MKLHIFVALVFQDLIVILSDVIGYHFPFYTLIHEAYHIRKHCQKVA